MSAQVLLIIVDAIFNVIFTLHLYYLYLFCRTLLLIMREMIGTERDYVRSLHYIIENYTKELLREDIPQALRGQRNVIFGNVERIYEFHQQYFLGELER